MLIIYSIVCGIGSTANTYVGNCIGEQDLDKANLYIKCSMIYSLTLNVIISVVCFIFKEFITSLYTSNPEVIELFNNLFPFVCIFTIIDGINSVVMGICKGLGRHKRCSIIMFLTNYVLGIPIILYCGFYKNWRIYGIMYGFLFNYTVMTIGIIYVLLSKSIKETIDEFAKELLNDDAYFKDQTENEKLIS